MKIMMMAPGCAALVALAVVVAVILLLALKPSPAAETAAPAGTVRSNEQRVTYLNALGWEVEPEPLEEQTVVIPRAFDGVYETYAQLQEAQGFDLAKYAGMEATRYTYRVLNHPSGDEVVADILVYRDRVIAGDVQSTALDGFMTGLRNG